MPNHCYYLAISFTNHLYLYSYIYSLAMHLRYSSAPLVYLQSVDKLGGMITEKNGAVRWPRFKLSLVKGLNTIVLIN